MKLITEICENIKTEEILNETTGEKERFITGIFLQSDVQNRNGRIYPLSILIKEVSRFNQELIMKNRALGELSHPSSPIINLDRVSHQITELKQNGKNFTGKAKILDTPMGKIVESFLKNNISIGVSSRGMGSVFVNKQGIQEVQDDFRLATIDIVADPSAPQAFVKGIMENVSEWIYEDGVFKPKDLEEIKETVKKTPKRNLGKVYVTLFQNMMEKVRKYK